jgi:hypothetical protein
MSYHIDSEVCDDKEVSDESGDDSNDAVNAASALLSLYNHQITKLFRIYI